MVILDETINDKISYLEVIVDFVVVDDVVVVFVDVVKVVGFVVIFVDDTCFLLLAIVLIQGNPSVYPLIISVIKCTMLFA